MKSPVITKQEGQLTLSFEPGLSDRHMSLRDCIAACVYQRGLGNIAIDLNKAPGNLSVETTPIYYLIDKFLNDQGHKQNAALAQLAPMLKQLAPLMKQAGLI
jgi:hypothetical protein